MEKNSVEYLADICQSGEDGRLLELERNLWNAPVSDFSSAEVDKAYSRIRGIIHHNLVRRLMKYALVAFPAFVGALVIGLMIGRSSSPEVIAVPSETVYCEALSGHKDTVELTLYDGSHIYLHSETSIIYPTASCGGKRELFLRGEAVFEVAKDTLHPFIVHAGGNQIIATGTKFNVRSYSDEEQMTTTLMEGGVNVTIPGQSSPISLKPGMALTVNNSTSDLSLYKVEEAFMPRWHKGEFNAYHLTLAQICHDLERQFGVKIMISDTHIASKVYFASFINGEGVDDILEALNIHKDFRIQKQDKFYFIH